MQDFDTKTLHKAACTSLHFAGHDAPLLGQQQATLRQDSSVENLVAATTMHVFGW